MAKLRIWFPILFTACFLSIMLPLATLAQDELTVDQLFEQARIAAFQEENYDQARTLAYRALDRSPDYHGIRIFVARLFAWEQKYPESRKELEYVLEKDPANRRALLAMIDVESWSGNPRQAYKWAQQGLRHHPGDEEFMLAKASALQKRNRFKDAEKTYKELIDSNPSRRAREALKSLRLKQMKYTASLSYRYDRFNEIFDPWKFWELQLSRQTPYGSVTGRLQYANRFGSRGLQLNVDAYPSLFQGMYAYLSGGYSQASIYPRYRFGVSLYKSLPSAFELEGGFRYLDFSASNTAIYTLSLSKYWGSYLFTARTYFVPRAAGNSQSFSLLARRYFGDARTYLGVSGGMGSASADIRFAEDIQKLDSWSLGIEGQRPLSNRVLAGGSASFDSEEFPNYRREVFSFKLYLSYRF